jgi:hypothetical protein
LHYKSKQWCLQLLQRVLKLVSTSMAKYELFQNPLLEYDVDFH